MPAVRSRHVEAPVPGLPLDALLQGLAPEAADALLRECLAEAALRRHLQRIHDSRYASDTPQPRELFRVA
jgi:hypothetical protein